MEEIVEELLVMKGLGIRVSDRALKRASEIKKGEYVAISNSELATLMVLLYNKED